MDLAVVVRPTLPPERIAEQAKAAEAAGASELWLWEDCFLTGGIAEWMHQVGAKPASQLTLLEEVTVAVRALLRGETVETEGRYVRLRGVALDHPPAIVPPVSLGVRGPKSLRLAGRHADGTVLDGSADPHGVAAARSTIDAGRSEAGRTDPHRLTVFAEPDANRDVLAAAGADCLVFVSPDETAPLDLTQVFP